MARTSHRQQKLDSEYLKGQLVSFAVKGTDFWGVGTVRTKHDGGDVKITGKVIARPGDTLVLEGRFEDSKWGRQFKATSYEVTLPADTAGVVGWLSAKLPQISRRRAEELVQRHGVEGLWAVLERGDVAALCEVDGITPPRAEEICAAYREHKGERDKMVRLKSWGLTDAQIARVLKTWGEDAERRIQANPYELAEVVDGFGWTRADGVALRMGVARDAESRIAASILHWLSEATFHGHCFGAEGKLVAIVSEKVLGGVETSKVRAVLRQLEDKEKVVRRGGNVYLPKLAKAEGELAAEFAVRAAAQKEPSRAA